VTSALQAVIFDFDGVIADSEPLHFRAFQQALAEDGLELSPKEYYSRYLGYDDVGAFKAYGEDHGQAMDAGRVAELVTRKGLKLQAMLDAGSVLFPGAVDFVRAAAKAVPIAIASGALRHEIDEVIEAAGVANLFTAIVASGDTPESKPSPAPYRLAFDRLREAAGTPLDSRRCVAIEDSRWGLESARGAGLRCVGVTNSYPADELTGAELVVSGLQALTIDALDRLCGAVAGDVRGRAPSGPPDAR
jgi:HAD superfamily hydrolase (TIGR01509 family)